MIAKVVTAGRGFRGLADYLTQDGRASWSESRHVPTDDPRLASRMMAAVASSQAALKQAAGVSARGRKCNDPALHLVLSWRDGETPTREEQTAAADSLLEKLSLADRQAVIVAHDDEDHRHVHVMVNRVSWEDGRVQKRGCDKRICSRWSSDYERERRDIQCPRREVVREAHEAGRPIPPRSRSAAPSPARQRGRFSFRRAEPRAATTTTIRRDRATGQPTPRSPVESALWRELYAASLAAGDDRDQAKARRRAFARRLDETREAWQSIEHVALPPARPPGRSVNELTREIKRSYMAAAAEPANVAVAPAGPTHDAQDARPGRRDRDRDRDGERETSRQSRPDGTEGQRPETPAGPTAEPSPSPAPPEDDIDRVSSSEWQPAEPTGRGQRRGLDRT